MSKADGTNTIQYLYDNDRAVAEYNGSGTLLRKYIYGPGLDEPIMMIVPGDPSETVYYYHADGQGTIIGLTNDSGAWVEKYAYTLYGKPAAASTVGNPYMYTGRRLDAETGLYYYRARYYDPHMRRFIETDPIGYAGGMNLYAYVDNNPVNLIDPYGLFRHDQDFFYLRQFPFSYVGGPGWPKFRKDKSSSFSGTIGVGTSGTAGAGKAATGTVLLAYDSKGNIGLVESAGGGGMGGVSASYGLLLQITNAEDIYHLKGWSVQTGGSFGEGMTVGVEHIVAGSYSGWNIFLGWGASLTPVELHCIAEYAMVQGRTVEEVADFVLNILSRKR